MMEAAIDVYRRAYNERMADWKTDAEQLANAAAVIEADREEAALRERKRIVAYLQTNPDPIVRNWISAQIEAGEHLKEQAKCQGQ
jgi:hypothetical protein